MDGWIKIYPYFKSTDGNILYMVFYSLLFSLENIA